MKLTQQERDQLSVLEVWVAANKREMLENPLMALYDLKKMGIEGKILDYAEFLFGEKIED